MESFRWSRKRNHSAIASTRPRYIVQPNEYTCGPTAVYNVVQWAQGNLTYAEIETRCQSQLPFGTTVEKLERSDGH
jgi:mRNA-degrading endonuclease toxin of MazEF toxin-antitoxin module